jgi:hypothetical protein
MPKIHKHRFDEITEADWAECAKVWNRKVGTDFDAARMRACLKAAADYFCPRGAMIRYPYPWQEK